MATAKDFRTLGFAPGRIDAAGKDLGRNVYWKLYAIENLVRILTHTVLSQQINANWWVTAVDPQIQGAVRYRRTDYATNPWHSSPGAHEIYYAFLTDLSKIIAANSHLFRPLIKDIDQWIARLEQIRLPRNIVGHMNWLSATDRKRVDVVYADLSQLVTGLVTSGIGFVIP